MNNTTANFTNPYLSKWVSCFPNLILKTYLRTIYICHYIIMCLFNNPQRYKFYAFIRYLL